MKIIQVSHEHHIIQKEDDAPVEQALQEHACAAERRNDDDLKQKAADSLARSSWLWTILQESCD